MFSSSFALSYIDVNECMFNNGGCQGDCCNSIGSYYCRCSPGFELSHDGVTCIGKSSSEPHMLIWKKKQKLILITKMITIRVKNYIEPNPSKALMLHDSLQRNI